MKRGLMTLLWCIAIYLIGCALAAWWPGSAAPTATHTGGALDLRHGPETVAAMRGWIFLASAAIAALASWQRALPGTD
jgi:hypothetical protein